MRVIFEPRKKVRTPFPDPRHCGALFRGERISAYHEARPDWVRLVLNMTPQRPLEIENADNRLRNEDRM